MMKVISGSAPGMGWINLTPLPENSFIIYMIQKTRQRQEATIGIIFFLIIKKICGPLRIPGSPVWIKIPGCSPIIKETIEIVPVLVAMNFYVLPRTTNILSGLLQNLVHSGWIQKQENSANTFLTCLLNRFALIQGVSFGPVASPDFIITTKQRMTLYFLPISIQT